MYFNDDMIKLLPKMKRGLYKPRDMWPFDLSKTDRLKIEIEKNGEVKTLAFEYARKRYLGHEKSWKILDSVRHDNQLEFNGWKINKIVEE